MCQKSTTLQRVLDSDMHVHRKTKIFPSKISPRVTFQMTGHLKGSTEQYRNNPTKTNKKW